MIIPLIVSLGVAWVGFLGLAMSCLAGWQADGMVVYGLIMIAGSVATRVFFDRI
jgi:hypothetical protein